MAQNVTIDFMSRSILHTHQFSWVFLVNWIMILFLSIFCLFYFNQLLGFVVTQTLGWFLWHRHGIYFKIQSIQISLLGGRVFFRNVVYIGTSQAVRIVHGNISWRYWIPRRQKSAFVTHVHPDYARSSALKLNFYGVEWFIYNREYAYDVLAKQEPPTAELAREFDNWQQELSSFERKVIELLPLHVYLRRLGIVIGNDDTESLVILSAPEAECTLDMASPSTKYDRYMTCVHANFHSPEADLRNNPDYKVSSITPENQGWNSSKGKHHIWRRMLRRKAQDEPDRPWLGLQRYMDHAEEPKRSRAANPIPQDRETATEAEKTSSDYNAHSTESTLEKNSKARSMATENNSDPDTSNTNEEMAESSENEEQHDNAAQIPQSDGEFRSRLAALPTEYAKVSQLVACDELSLKLHVDVVGKANVSPSETNSSHGADAALESNMNPIFDVQLESKNTKVTYGPYAERQRQSFYSVFFPRNCSTASPPQRTPEGTPCYNGLRMHPEATMNIRLLGESTFVIPTREFSKDEEFAAMFMKSLENFEGEIQRTYGWLEVHADDQSYIELTIPFLPDATGFYTKCKIELEQPDVRSSVNHDTMMSAAHHSFTSVQHQPLEWNGLQTYVLENKSTDLNFYALREHVTLVNDMATDFTTGPPVPYALFTPAKYELDWDAVNFALYLNVNKGNIINMPTNLGENTFLIFKAPVLHGRWDVPRDQITSPTTLINTVFDAEVLDLELSAPNWHTLHGFLDSQRMARIDNFHVLLQHHNTTLNVSQRDSEAHFDTNPSRFVDTQVLEVYGEQFAMTAHGFLIDYLMRVRENYFGHAYHFQTTEEFLEKHKDQRAHEKVEFSRADVDNDTQVRIRFQRGCFLLPQRLYSCRDCVVLNFVQLGSDIRFTNYYMDLQIDISPLAGRLIRGLNPGTVHEEALSASFTNADLSITQISVHAHRMFGLPPAEPTYVVRWDFDVGDISSDFPLDFVLSIRNAGMVFKHSFNDDENKPILSPEELNDVVFVSMNIASVDAVIRPTASLSGLSSAKRPKTSERFQLSTSKIKFRFDDLANHRYSARRTLEIPLISFKGYGRDDQLVLDGKTALYGTWFTNKPNNRQFYEKQQTHIALHDALFHRAPFLLDLHHRRMQKLILQQQAQSNKKSNILRPCIPLTPFDPPLTRDNLAQLASQFAAMDERRDSSDSSQHTSLESLASDSEDSYSADTSDDSDVDVSKVKSNLSKARAQSMGPARDVFPFSGESVSSDREKLRSHSTNFGLHPSQWHSNAPFLVVNDDVENVSCVLQIMPVNVSLTPELFALVSAFDTETSVDFEMQLDALQFNVVRGLVKEEEFLEVLRHHITTQIIVIDLAETIGSDQGIRLEIKDVDAMIKIAGEVQGANVAFHTLSVSFRHGSKEITQVSRINAASLVLSKFILWWQQTSKEDGTGSLQLESIDASVAAEKIDWIVEYVGVLMSSLAGQARTNTETGSLNVHKSTLSKQERLQATFYSLTMAGKQMGIEQDSYVLSRPSGAVQSAAHVRTKTSWRLVMRLRFLFQRLPASERARMQNEITQGKFVLPNDALEQTVEVYRNWRSWEQSKNLVDTEIYRLVFDDKSFQEYMLSLSTRLSLGIDSMVIRIVYPDLHDHFAGLDSLRMQLVSTQKNEKQNINLTFRCSKARARGSVELLVVAASIITALSALEKKTQDEANRVDAANANKESAKQKHTPTARKKSTTFLDSSAHDQKSGGWKALQANVSVFLLDLTIEFDLETMHVETQNHQIQFTTSVELMRSTDIESLFHTGTLISSDGAFRIYQAERNSLTPHDGDVIDSLLQGVQLGYASREVGQQSNTWVTVSAESLSFISHPTMPSLVLLAVHFLKTDMPIILDSVKRLDMALTCRAQVLKEASESAAATGGSTPEISPLEKALTFSGIYLENEGNAASSSQNVSNLRARPGVLKASEGHYVNFDIGLVKLRARIVDDLRFLVQGKNLSLKTRRTGAIISSLDLSRSTLGIHFGDGSAAVANVQLENIRTVLRYDPELSALAIFNNANAVRLETMSLVWMLEYAKYHNLHSQVDELIKNTQTVFELIQDLKPPNDSNEAAPAAEAETQDAVEKTKDKMRLRMVNRVREISIRLPLDTSSFKLTIAGAHSRFENFQSFQELGSSSDVPETIGAGIEDLNLELITVRRPVREMIRLNFDVSMQREDSKILFNITSDYIRLALDPEAVGALFVAAEKLEKYSSDVLKPATSSLGRTPSRSEMASTESQSGGDSKSFKVADLENVRVKLVLQYLTITWYTNSDSTNGIVFGFDKLQIRGAKLIFHLQLAGAYVTPVSESKSAIQERLNTAYLPLIDAYAFVSRGKEENKTWIQGEVSGRSLTLSLTPTVAPWVLSLVDSATETNDTLQRLAEARRRSQQGYRASKSSSPPGNTYSTDKDLQLPFNLRVNTHFDRSVLRLMDDAERNKEVSLELFSPTLDAAMEFRDNQLLLRIDASHTSNEVFPKAITNIKATMALLTLSLKQRYQKRNNGIRTPARTPSNSLPTSPALSSPRAPQQQPITTQSGSIFNSLEMDIRIHFGAQKLYLSCLPFGKVGATLATDGVDFLLTTPGLQGSENAPSYTTTYGLMKKARISVQHMYSREVSAMVEFTKVITVGMHRLDEPYKIATNLTDLKLDLDLSKLHDMRIFFDIWAMYESSSIVHSRATPEPEPDATKLRRKYSTTSQNKPQLLSSPTFSSTFSLGSDSENDEFGSEKDEDEGDGDSAEHESPAEKYKPPYSVPFPFDFNFNMSNLRVNLGMGPAIGDAKIKLDRFWFAILQNSAFGHMVHAGVGTLIADLEGRFGGALRLDGIMAKLALQWNNGYPLIHTKVRLSNLGFYFSLDFHPFIVGTTKNLSAVITTQDRENVLDDRVHIALTCESVSLVMTALVVVHAYDVVSLFKRLQSQISSVPVFMPEVAQGEAEKNAEKSNRRKQKILTHMASYARQAGSRVLIDIRLGELLLHAFPTEFVDNIALKVYAHRVEVHYDRKHTQTEYQTGLDFALDECIVGLANIKGGGYKGDLTDLDYVGFLNFIGKSSIGGTIVNTPEITILMDTWENLNEPNTVYYTFSNEVHGSIEVGWNLGSVNFIKEMMNTHRNAWAARQNVRQDIYEATIGSSEDKPAASTAQAYREAAANLEKHGSLSSRRSTLKSIPDDHSTAADSGSRNAERKPGDTRSGTDDPRVLELKGVRYIAKEIPVILIPQLRDLGDATPPIEWLGINRERIPLLLHHALTREIAYGADYTEKLYLELIGRQG